MKNEEGQMDNNNIISGVPPTQETPKILEDNVKAQKNHRKFLPPDKKAQILENDAAAHQKYRESLPPKKKAQIFGE
jgi:hypothetical protein